MTAEVLHIGLCLSQTYFLLRNTDLDELLTMFCGIHPALSHSKCNPNRTLTRRISGKSGSFNDDYPAPMLLKEHRRLLGISRYTDDQSRECICVDDRTFGLVLTNGASMLQGCRCDLKHLTR